ncbi:hypothetical protein B9Z19DRAFT_1092725 [Tuber borchii]|uniref:Uncharacterized protein n=1 Tax=Tuber borchii TaxID=42251 RepID=A0A2T6ZGI0_TUBBO|nr:hypothetical protein B9Z19DRAFT_1092725 [Tuber borchii]
MKAVVKEAPPARGLSCRVNSARMSNPRYQFAVLHPPEQGKSKAWDSMITSLDLVAFFSLGFCHLLSGRQRPNMLRCARRGVRYGPRGIFGLEAGRGNNTGGGRTPPRVGNSYQGAAKVRDLSPPQRGAPCRQDTGLERDNRASNRQRSVLPWADMDGPRLSTTLNGPTFL